MKRSIKSIKAASYISGILAICAAALLAFLLVLSLLGLIHPRTTPITLTTKDVAKVYDDTPLMGSQPTLTAGTLHPGHYIDVRNLPQLTKVGQLANTPDYQILDETGAVVTGQYDILEDFGTLAVTPRPIRLSTTSKTVRYTGEFVPADEPLLLDDMIEGHRGGFSTDRGMIIPGETENGQKLTIFNANNEDVTDQYDIIENYGTLTVKPILLTLRTASAQKSFDGKPIRAEGWDLLSGELLEGHTLTAKTISVLEAVGTCDNQLTVTISDTSGTDISYFYEFEILTGTLKIDPLPLKITTGSASKIYDGTPLFCDDWRLTSGNLEDGATIVAAKCLDITAAGTAQNHISFQVLDAQGQDITSHYDIQCTYGTLTVTPRPLVVRTGSATKAYDGISLYCDSFEIISGNLCSEDTLILACTSIYTVGYSENFVLGCTILGQQGAGQVDVTDCYQITFQYGILRITQG